MSAGYVISLLPNLQNSFKLAVPLDVVGAFQQDRSTGIAGTLGVTSKMIPVTMTMHSSLNTVQEVQVRSRIGSFPDSASDELYSLQRNHG